MKLDPDICYRALAARDARFDGLFYVGVASTRIYCRPVCTARTPGKARCTFFASAAAAEREGYRPCLKCRPESAPGNAPVDAPGRIAHAAATRIAAGALNNGNNGKRGGNGKDGGASLDDLAATFRLSARQLRRIVQQHLGVSPVQLAQTHRLLLARQLLVETGLPLIDVAHAAGFGSVRRFNHAFRTHYRATPGDLRKCRADHAAGAGTLQLALAYRPPLAWTSLLAFLRARTLAGAEVADDRAYARSVAIGHTRGWIRVDPHPARPNCLRLEVSASLVPALPAVRVAVRQMLDLDARPDIVDAHLGADRRLRRLVAKRPGLRVPGSFSGFELAMRAIIGQQVSVAAARTVAGRVVASFGEPLPADAAAGAPPGLTHCAPTPQRIAATTQGDLARLGMPGKRADSLRALAAAMRDGRLMLDPGDAIEPVIDELCALPGIGEWTATCIAMRALRWPDAFPHGDLGVRKALGLSSAAELKAAAESWRPWRAYAVMHLWESMGEKP